MRTRWAGASGWYQAACEQGYCALAGGQAASKHEGQIFTLISYVLGAGQQNLQLEAYGRAVRLDMAFDLPSGEPIAVEYDGAYWHLGHEERDLDKTFRVSRSGYWVIRIREDPLQPFTPDDVQVPARASAATCAQLALLHPQAGPTLALVTAQWHRSPGCAVGCHWPSACSPGSCTTTPPGPPPTWQPTLQQRATDWS